VRTILATENPFDDSVAQLLEEVTRGHYGPLETPEEAHEDTMRRIYGIDAADEIKRSNLKRGN
jgi:hypothetical protein